MFGDNSLKVRLIDRSQRDAINILVHRQHNIFIYLYIAQDRVQAFLRRFPNEKHTQSL